MHPLLLELAWFLPWCWFVNMSFTVFGFVMRSYSGADRPLDGGRMFLDHRRLLGDSTTWGGLLLAILFGMVGELAVPGHYFFVLAVLVFLGHTLGSFMKRRLGYQNGSFLPLIDHGDYLLLIALASFVTGFLPLIPVLIAYILTISITPLVTLVAHKVGVRAEPL